MPRKSTAGKEFLRAYEEAIEMKERFGFVDEHTEGYLEGLLYAQGYPGHFVDMMEELSKPTEEAYDPSEDKYLDKEYQRMVWPK